MAETYTIKPLEWKRTLIDWQQLHVAETPFCTYTVIRTRYDCEPTKPWGPWRWKYDRDQNSIQCETANLGKAACEADWLKRISGALQKALSP